MLPSTSGSIFTLSLVFLGLISSHFSPSYTSLPRGLLSETQIQSYHSLLKEKESPTVFPFPSGHSPCRGGAAHISSVTRTVSRHPYAFPSPTPYILRYKPTDCTARSSTCPKLACFHLFDHVIVPITPDLPKISLCPLLLLPGKLGQLPRLTPSASRSWDSTACCCLSKLGMKVCV